MKKVFKSLTLALLCAAMLLVVSCNSEITTTTKWCSMVYMDMGNLVPDAINNLYEMASNASVSDNSKFFILTGGALDDGYTDYLKLEKGTSVEKYQTAFDWLCDNVVSEKNFLDSAAPDTVQIWEVTTVDGAKKIVLKETLTGGSICESITFNEFLTYCNEQTASGADSYKRVLTMWGFGSGSYGGMLEDYSDDDATITLSLADFQESLRAFGHKINIINLDLSNMQSFEMAYTLKGLTNFIVGSQANASSIGLDYEKWTGAIAENPSIDESVLANLIATSAMDKLGTDNKYSSWSVIDMRDSEKADSAFGKLETAWSDYLFNVVNPRLPGDRNLFLANLETLRESDVVDKSMDDDENIFSDSMYDLKAFVNTISDSKASFGDPKGYGTALLSALDGAVTNYVASDSKIKKISSGLSVCILRDHATDKKFTPVKSYLKGGDSWYTDYKAYCAAEGYKYFLERYAEID